ncbi:TRAP transporter, 4TM/12TM fusion protein [Tistlia consotensis]|uniref:TRAP transporter, 4TM/12TM fusion protein n=1 Tax=Tistlia consotensis USBA 355 TaxID=560819 RepID=A0A1Y6BS06_9PROT|nr:TRAP transporter fused permease subunit [Tistlia consotensis]SMF14720.1 TRAP transporter, 4TM/12TM fusion protein [Tistlia consotensis USBA 355]SNR49303.1 TRAP transporter, 4TM/12TM fusion protein [Tistlia consotensis]
MRAKATAVLAAALGLFTLYTAAAGPYVSLIQRPVFLALAVCLGLALYPLWAGSRLRPLGLALDLLAAAVAVGACAYVAVNQDRIMTELPWAEPHDELMVLGLVVVILELSRRAIGLVFPLLVLAGLAYGLLGQYLPGALGHRAFGIGFVTETLFLGDLGLWGLLLGVAATTIAAFVMFGAMILHSGGGDAFIDLAMRLGGRSPGGAAKIATIASAFFATVSGSAVANTATTGNFTIPMMKRLGYPPAFAGAVEAVASTGGQIAPPVLGAAAFLMVEIIGVSYLRIMGASVLPAILFFLAVFLTVHVIAVQRGLRIVPEDELPPWSRIARASRLLPLLAALLGLFAGVLTGHSVQTAAFWGICGQVGCFLAFGLAARRPLPELGRAVLAGVVDGGKGLVIIGVLLAGAQVLVSMINMTGVGVAVSGALAGLAGHDLMILAAIVALVCLIMGMGIPTTAAYVLVAAVMTPALIEAGVPELTAHMFVFYFATLSVITPPVCVGVFVAAGIAQTGWLAVARDAFKLAAVTYVIPFLFIVYPGMLGEGGWPAIARAAVSGVVFVVASAFFFGGQPLTGRPWIDRALLLGIVVLALAKAWAFTLLGALLLAGFGLLSRRRRRAAAALS